MTRLREIQGLTPLPTIGVSQPVHRTCIHNSPCLPKLCVGNQSRGTTRVMDAIDVYSGVVGIETVRLILALAAMGEHKVCAADIGNAFLYGKNKEKTMIIAGLNSEKN
jgi:hypothetical protein